MLISDMVSFFIPYSLLKKIKLIAYIFNSKLVSKQFNACGKNFFIRSALSLEGEKYISIGDDFDGFSRIRLEAFDAHLGKPFKPEIVIGNNVSINNDCHIGCVNKIVIGNNVLIASKVYITDHFHGEISVSELAVPPNKRPVVSKGVVIINDNVWIGEGVAIMPNVTIGENSIIGANSVVTKDVPANVVVGGVPAKIIKKLV